MAAVAVELTPELQAARRRVADASRELAAAGLVPGTAGNVSERVGELVAITPTGAVLESLTAASVTVVDLTGAVVGGELAPSSELGLHLGVYAQGDAGAVVHTHAPMATALACVLDELPCVHYGMLRLGGAVRVARYHTFGSPELAEATVRALDGRRAALMANHGAITYGSRPRRARWRTRGCSNGPAPLYWHAAAIGTPRVLSDADLAAVRDAVTRRGYGAPRRHAPAGG